MILEGRRHRCRVTGKDRGDRWIVIWRADRAAYGRQALLFV
jgi:hypothetical protein